MSSWQEYKKKHGIVVQQKDEEEAKQQEPEKQESAWERYKRVNGTPDSNSNLRKQMYERQETWNNLQARRQELENAAPTATGNRDAEWADYYRRMLNYANDTGDSKLYWDNYKQYQNAAQKVEGQYASHAARHAEADARMDNFLSRQSGFSGAKNKLEAQTRQKDRDQGFYGQMANDADRIGSQKLYDKAYAGFGDSYSKWLSAIDNAEAEELKHLEANAPDVYIARTLSDEDVDAKVAELTKQKDALQSERDEAYNEYRSLQEKGQVAYVDSHGVGHYGPVEDQMRTAADKLQAVEKELAKYTEAARLQKNRRGEETYNQYLGGGKILPPEIMRNVETGKARYEADRNAAIEKGAETLDYGLNFFAKARGVWRGDKDRLEEAGWDSTFDTAANLTSEDENLFYALYADDPQKAMEFITYANNYRNQQNEEWWAEWAHENGWNAAKAFVMALGSRATSGVANLIDPHSATVNRLAGGASGLLAGGSQLLNEWSGTIDTDIPILRDIINGKGLGDFYQLANSIVESGINAYAAGKLGEFIPGGGAEGIGALGVMLMGSSASAADYNESIKRGLTPGEAQKHALAAGINEALFEFVSMDKLVDTEKLLQAGTIGKKIKAIFIQSGVEASEEFCTTVANRLADAAQARRDGYDSQIENRAKELIALGMSRDEALEKAEKEWLTELINDAIGGFISGGAHDMAALAVTAPARAVSYVRGERAANQAAGATSTNEQQAAMRAYAEANGIEWRTAENAAQAVKQAETATQNAENAGQQEQPKTRQEKRQERREEKAQAKSERETGADVRRVQEHIDKQFSGKSVQEQTAIRDKLVQQYGEAIAPALYSAVRTNAYQQAAQNANPTAIQAAKEAALEGVTDQEMRRAVSSAYDQAAVELAIQTKNTDALGRYYQQIRGTGTGTMTMEAIVKGKDGQETRSAITGMSEDGKSVTLADGSTVAVKDLQADADTMDIIHEISALGLGKNTDKVFQAYKKSGKTGLDGYRWIMDYTTAIDQGRNRRISLQEAIKRSSLDAETVMEAYEMGHKETMDETRKAVQKNENRPKRKGVTGRVANIDTSAIQNEPMSKQEREQFDLANQIFEILGVDVKWESSKTRNGKYVGANGSYLNGAVTLDIHAGRNDAIRDINSGILATTGHELTHFLQEYAPEQYQALKEFVLQQIVKNGKYGEATLERMIQDKQNRSSKKLTKSQAEDEVVADACQTMLRDSKALREFAEQKPGAAKGIIRWLADWFKKIKAAFSRSAQLSEQARFMEKLEKDVREAFGQLWDDALREAVRVHDEIWNMESPSTEGGEEQLSMREPVEITDRLIAWHNMSEEALRSALELGGLAMPSWAIKTADKAHTSYGDISVIAQRSLVDPKMNRNSMIFGGDAWTPVFPDVNYKISSEAVDALTDEIEGLIGKDALRDLGGAALDETNIADQFSKHGGAVSNYYKRNQALRYAYLKSIGQDIELPKTAKRLDDFGKYENDAVENFISRLVYGKKSLDYYRSMTGKEIMQEQDLKKAITDTMVTMYGEEVRDAYAPDELSFRDIDAMLNAANKYFREGIREEIDSRAVGKAIDKVIDEAAYEKWIREKLNATIERKGIRNNKDPFRPSGKRRSFDELNYAYNLANIVKAMKAQPKQGRTQFLSGPGSVKGAALKNYSTVEQARADRGRLVNTEEEGKAAYDEYNDMLADILDRMSKNGDRFDTADALIEILQHAKTEDAIYRYMERELKDWYNVSRELAHDIYKLIGQINELPMEYFEGKTYDAVTFDQTAAVVVPDSIDPALKQQLAMAGANVVEYRDGDNEDRLAKVNSVGNAQFSERDYDTTSDLELMEQAAEEWDEGRWNELLKDEAGDVRERLETAAKSERKARELQRKFEKLQADIQSFECEGASRIAVKDFTRNVLDSFGIPSGQRTEVGQLLQSLTDYLLAGNHVNRADILPIFEGLVQSGKRQLAADDALANIRDDLKGRRIYVDKTVREEFGDDYEAFRKRAFGLGITLTGRNTDTGIDTVNAEMADIYPGSFDASETDLKAALENIVDTAESGKTSTVSLLEALAEEERTSGTPVREQLQDMLDQFTRQIEIFEDRAKLERKARAGDAAEIAKLKSKAHEAANKLSEMRKERNALRRKMQNANNAKQKAVDDALRKLVVRDAKQLAEAVRQKQELADKLAEQIKREEQIVSGALKPPAMQKLLKAVREEAAEKATAHKEEVFQRYKDRKEAAAIRNRIANLKAELQRRLTNPTDRRYVPAELATSMVDLLDALDTSPREGTQAAAKYQTVSEGLRALADAYNSLTTDETVGWEYKSEYDEEIRDQIKELAKTMQGRNIRDLNLEELQQVYDAVKTIRDSMRQATKLLNTNQFRDIYEAIQSIVDQQKRMTPIADVGWKERNKRRRLLEGLSVMRAVEMMSGWERDSALYSMFQGVEQGQVDADNWIMGYDKAMRPLKTGKNEKAYRDALTKQLDFGATDKESGKTVKMTKLQAIQLYMTWQREQTNDKLVHLQKGGATILDALAIQNGKGSKAASHTVRVTPELISNIENSLTEWDRAYMKEIRGYLDKEAKAVNRVLYALKHRVLTTEAAYMPYVVDKGYLETKLEGSDVFNLFVKTPGSTQALQKKAPQPVIIDGLDNMMARHVRDQAQYIGLALPIRDFAKVFNGRLSSDDGDVYTSLKKTIEDNFEAGGTHLLVQALLDIQNSGAGEAWKSQIAAALNRLHSSFVKAALLINPSVTIKQAASYIAAESVLSHTALERGNHPIWTSTDKSKAFMPGGLIAHLFNSPEGRTAQRLYDEIDAHTSMHYIRRQGMSQAELANEAQRDGKIKRAANAVGARMEKNKAGHIARKAGEMLNPLNWIQRMDVATTATLWVACKEQAKLDGMKAGTTEYWNRVTELYERCLRETQPMYDGLHRTAHQKQGGGLMQYLFPFRTVPIQNHGQIVAAYETMKAMKGQSKEKQAAAKKFFAKTVWAQTQSAVVFSLMTFLAAALKRKTKKYRDDDEEFTLESFLEGLGGDTASTLFSVAFPMWGSEAWNIGSRIFDKIEGTSGYSYDAFTVGAVDMLNELATAGDKLFADIGKKARGENVVLSDVLNDVLNILTKGAKIAGIPADTVKTYYAGIKANVQDAIEGRIPALNDETWERATAVNANRFYKAWSAGDAEKMQTVLDEVKASGKSEDSISSAFNARAKEAYEAGEISLEEYADYLGKTGMFDGEKISGKIKTILRDEYTAGARVEDETIDALITYCGMDEDKAWETVQKWEGKAEHAEEEDYNWSKYDDLRAAIDANKDISGIVAELTEHGTKASDIQDEAKKYLKKLFIDGKIPEDKYKNQLSRYCGIRGEDANKIVNDAKCKKATGYAPDDLDDAYRDGEISKTDVKNALTRYGGLTGTDADKKIRWWDQQKAHPDLEITEGACNSWYDGSAKTRENGHESAKAAGMSLEAYLNAKAKLDKISDANGNGTGEDEYIAAIAKMNLTPRQKDALYYEKYKGGSRKGIYKTW